MSRGGDTPGPIAARTFELGFKVALIGGLGILGAGHWFGIVSLSERVTLVIVLLLFPVYLVFVSMVLSVWLGYAADEHDLQAVAGEEHDPWENWP